MATLIRQEPDRETEDRYAKAREEIRALFERYRMTGRTAPEAGEEPAAEQPDEELALTGR